MVNRNRAIYTGGLNKGFGSKFRVGSQVQQETPEEGQRTYRPKHCEYNNKDEDKRLNTLNDRNYQALSQKFRHWIHKYIFSVQFQNEWLTIIIKAIVIVLFHFFLSFSFSVLTLIETANCCCIVQYRHFLNNENYNNFANLTHLLWMQTFFFVFNISLILIVTMKENNSGDSWEKKKKKDELMMIQYISISFNTFMVYVTLNRHAKKGVCHHHKKTWRYFSYLSWSLVN